MWVCVTGGWAAACPTSPFLSALQSIIYLARSYRWQPIPFSLPLSRLLVLSTKTVDARGVKEVINEWHKKGEREENTIILSDRCYHSFERHQEQRDCSEGDFHCLKTLKDKKHLRKLLQKFEWESRLFTEICSVSDIHFLRLFLSLKFILSLKSVTMSGTTSDQLHRSTLNVYLVSFSLLVLCVWFLFTCGYIGCNVLFQIGGRTIIYIVWCI